MKLIESPLLKLLERDQLLDTMPSGLFLVDCDMNIVYWNREAERITGYSAEEAVGQHCSFLEGIECATGCGLYDEDSPEKPIIGNDCRIRGKDGNLIYISKNIDLLRHKGEIIGGIESFIDTTEQKNLEDALRQHSEDLESTVLKRTAALEAERTRLRSVLDSMTDLSYIVSADFRISFINQALLNKIGPAEGELCYRIIHNKDTICENCPVPEVLTGKTVHEERVFPLDSQTYEIIHTPLYSSQGETEKLAVCRDITERNEANERLIEANRQLDSFVYTVSHDLRSPLTPIIGFAEFLKNEYRDKLDSQGIDLLTEIESQGNRMLALMEDLLQLSRVGHVAPPDEPVNATAILQNVLNDMASETTEKKVTIVSAPMPRLRIPEPLIEELFSNLLHNALRYGCTEGETIDVLSEEADGHVLIKIIDHGPGIPQSEKKWVFDVFYRGADVKQLPGTGIGLATVKKIVRQYDGKIELLDTPGGGCTVALQFPSSTM